MLIYFCGDSIYPLTCTSRLHLEDTLLFAEEESRSGSALSGIYKKQQYPSATKMLTDREDQPMVQMMPVLRAVVGSESMSSRHMCSRKVSAMAALSCCVWMKAEPMSWVFVWGMVFDGATVEILQEKTDDYRYNRGHSDCKWQLSWTGTFVQDSLTFVIFSKVSFAGYIVYIRYT